MNDHERDELIERVSQALDVPEPSPLFWDHFPARVRAAVAAVPAEAPLPWWKRRAVMLAFPLAVAVAVASWTILPRESAAPEQIEDVAAAGALLPDSGEMTVEDADWAVVTSVAASAGVDMLHEAGFGVAPGSADAAIEDLDAAQRADLVAMLRAEMKGDGLEGI